MTYAITFDAAFLVSRSMYAEIRGQTLASLLMLPTSTGKILYSKLAGWSLVWLPGPIYLFCGMTLLPGGREFSRMFFQQPQVAIVIIPHFFLVPHIAAVFATIVRWGADLPISIGIGIGTFFLTVVIINTVPLFPRPVLMILMGMGLTGLSCACHISVRLRTEALAER